MSGIGLILTLGKSTVHVKTSLLNYSPNHLILLTSEEFASTARRQLSHWKRQFDLEGEVLVIKDLFTEEGAEHIMTQTLLAIDFLNMAEFDTIFLGITGGTMHMAAAAASAATMADVPVFYVKHPHGEQVIQPNKDVIEMPTLNAFSKLSRIPPEALELFISVFNDKEGEERGTLTASEARNIGMPPGYLDYLTRHRVLDQIDASTYKFTYSGISIVRMLYSNPNIGKLIKAKTGKAEEPDHMFG
ncbi:MAG: hypothetical protein HOH79_04925 [Euryarchaeota archaeon]|jgi:hypothetical protein|nr:hypothetical protein [Euryarchaeota archaeon]MBT7638242.1 hypothetical protein [Euryarchaeota archaeon]